MLPVNRPSIGPVAAGLEVPDQVVYAGACMAVAVLQNMVEPEGVLGKKPFKMRGRPVEAVNLEKFAAPGSHPCARQISSVPPHDAGQIRWRTSWQMPAYRHARCGRACRQCRREPAGSWAAQDSKEMLHGEIFDKVRSSAFRRFRALRQPPKAELQTEERPSLDATAFGCKPPANIFQQPVFRRVAITPHPVSIPSTSRQNSSHTITHMAVSNFSRPSETGGGWMEPWIRASRVPPLRRPATF